MRLPIFVYGTLTSGSDQALLLGDLRRVSATARGALYSLPAGYPALQPGGEGRVHGELVDPPDERVLALLDRYEGVAEGLYRRTQIDVVVGLRTVRAWAWVMDDPKARGGRLVRSGRWRATRRR